MTTDGAATTGELDAAAANEATVSQLNTINETIAQTQPLVAQQGDILTLQKEYADNIKPGFVKGIIDLAQVCFCTCINLLRTHEQIMR
jgi:hypothetical protein